MNYFQFTGSLVLMFLCASANVQAQNGLSSAQLSTKEKKQSAPESAKKAQTASTVLGQKTLRKHSAKSVVTTGRIVGSVYFRGVKPEGQRINMSSSLRSRCGVFKRIYPYHVNHASKMPQTLVYLNDPPAVSWTQRHVQQVQMRRCDWKPSLLGARQGDVLMLQNLDAASMHILFQYEPQDGPQKQTEHSSGRERQRDMWISQKNQRVALKLNNPGFIQVNDDQTQAWSQARLRVFSHPFFALTDDKGEFVMANIPVGQYHLRAWNRTLGEDEQIVDVRPGQTSFISLAYNAEGPIHPIQKTVPLVEKDEKKQAEQELIDLKKNPVPTAQPVSMLKKKSGKTQAQAPLSPSLVPSVKSPVQSTVQLDAKKAGQASNKSVKAGIAKKAQASPLVVPDKVDESHKMVSPPASSTKKVAPKVSAKTAPKASAASAKPAPAQGEN